MGNFRSRFTAVHATHTTASEIDGLASAKANVCVCPATERNLGDGIAPADTWAGKFIDVCLGSDSQAQIDLLEEARELECHLRLEHLERAILSPYQLFDYATRGGARSLGLKETCDFFTVDLNDPSIAGATTSSLLSTIVFAGGRSAVRDVFVAGKRVIEDGRHAQQDAIVQRFIEVQKRIWQ